MIYEQDWTVRIQEVNTKLKMKFTGILEVFQEAATIQFEKLDYGIKDRKENSAAVIILNSIVNMKRKPEWNEKIKVRTWCNELNKIYCYRNFELYGENGELIGTGLNKLVLMDLSKRKIIRIDDKVRQDITLENKFLYENNIKDIKIPECKGREKEQIIRNKDIDINGHINNVAFVELALNALSNEEYKNLNKMNLEVCYKKECKNQEKIKTILYMQNEEYTIVLKNIEIDMIYAVVKIY